jgi:hypothetical protein
MSSAGQTIDTRWPTQGHRVTNCRAVNMTEPDCPRTGLVRNLTDCRAGLARWMDLAGRPDRAGSLALRVEALVEAVRPERAQVGQQVLRRRTPPHHAGLPNRSCASSCCAENRGDESRASHDSAQPLSSLKLTKMSTCARAARRWPRFGESGWITEEPVHVDPDTLLGANWRLLRRYVEGPLQGRGVREVSRLSTVDDLSMSLSLNDGHSQPWMPRMPVTEPVFQGTDMATYGFRATFKIPMARGSPRTSETHRANPIRPCLGRISTSARSPCSQTGRASATTAAAFRPWLRADQHCRHGRVRPRGVCVLASMLTPPQATLRSRTSSAPGAACPGFA